MEKCGTYFGNGHKIHQMIDIQLLMIVKSMYIHTLNNQLNDNDNTMGGWWQHTVCC